MCCENGRGDERQCVSMCVCVCVQTALRRFSAVDVWRHGYASVFRACLCYGEREGAIKQDVPYRLVEENYTYVIVLVFYSLLFHLCR